jgi:uncharacterized protein DUF4129
VRLRPELGALLLGFLLGVATPAFPATQAPTQAEIDSAIKKVKSDPDFAAEKTVRRLVWDADEKPAKRPSKDWTRWFSWLTDLFVWIGEISQMLMWLIIAALVALLALFVVRMIRAGSGTRMAKRFVAPTHVQDLDIRPESLPDDIGATARELWDRGEHRAALALLYRGLLSRLAHAYEVPIRDSSTEGDCLAIAARTLESRRLDYATQLVRTWQRAIYGGLSIEDVTVHELCANFDAHLERPLPAGTASRASFAGGASA